MPTLLRLAVALVAILLVSACGDDKGGQVHTASNGDEFNDADVAFATGMIPHHAQALVMVDMTLGRDLSPEVGRLAEEIRGDQTAEIETMVDWLTAWDRPIPDTARDHAHAHAHGSGGPDEHAELPGMVSAQQLRALEQAEGKDFERRWLELMVEHHRGAIEMARTEQDAGLFGPAVKLAESIEASQQTQVERMERLLTRV